MKRKKFYGIAVILALVCAAVGYAAIQASISVGGTANVNGDASNFADNLLFDSASTSTTGATATLAADKKSITFTTQDLKAIGDNAVLSYTIKNSSNYGATVAAVNCTSTDTNYDTYVEVIGSRTANLTISKGSTSAAETITVRMKKTYPETTAKSISFTCTLTGTASAAE